MSRTTTLASWTLLAALLALTLGAAATFDRTAERTGWPSLVGDEATYLMQAESLAFDFDQTYTPADHERFVAHWGLPPDGLILQSGDDGRTLTYGKPVFYALSIAPFVRFSPTRGPFVANAFYLALAALAAAWALGRAAGAAAPAWVAVFVYGSVAFAYVFWAHSDLFLMVLVALALSLAYGTGARHRHERGAALPEVWEDAATERRGPYLARWAAAGALLGLVALSRPFYGALLLPLAFAVPAERRRTGLAGLAGGVLLAVLLAVGVNFAVHGTWSSYGGERMGFYSYTGFPGVDFPAEEWSERLAGRPGKGSWTTPERWFFDLKPRVQAYNGLYLLAGRHVGIVPYFLPLLLGFVAFRKDAGRWALPIAVLLAVAGFLYVRAFNFWGGGGAIANRYFLPLYPAFWFLVSRRASAAWPAVAALAAGLFLWPLWSAPRAFPRTEEGGYRHVSEIAARLLPYETTQDHLKPSGRDDFIHGNLWIKPLSPSIRAYEEGAVMAWRPDRPAELLVGSPRPLSSLTVTFPGEGAPGQIELSGGEVGFRAFTPDGGAMFEVLLDDPYARHRMWWDKAPWNLYRLRIEPPPGVADAPLVLRLAALSGPPAS